MLPDTVRILITGASGQLGRSLRDQIAQRPGAAFEATFLDRQSLDITRAEDVAAWLDRHPADLVLNAAAYTAVDQAASCPDLAMAANAHAPGVLARACAQRGIRLLHVSTDYVFDGQAEHAYVEDDAANPLNTYGLSKLEGERQVLAHAPDSILLRTSWVFSAYGGNFVKTMLRLGRERNALQVIDDQLGGPTWAGDIARVMLEVAARPRVDTPAGVYHFSGQPWVSWYGFAQEILAQALARGLIERLPDIQAISASHWPSPEPRPANSRLDSQRLMTLLGRGPCDWRVGLGHTLDALA